MSSKKQDTHTASDQQHGTIASYVVGFLLSLAFTFIPYYLVVERVVTGVALIATILVFAVIQMIIQIVFFLHLGREKKPRWQLVFFIFTIGAILLVVVASLWIMHHLRYNMSPVTPSDVSKKLVEGEGIYQIEGEKTGACRGAYTTHKVTLEGGVINPASISARQCDRISFINEDAEPRYLMFGSDEQPEAYGGEDMLTVRKGRAKTIILNEQGTHQFYDRDQPESSGSFTVEP